MMTSLVQLKRQHQYLTLLTSFTDVVGATTVSSNDSQRFVWMYTHALRMSCGS